MKKIVSLIILFFFLFGIFGNGAHAVQLFGEDINYQTRLSIPPVIDADGNSYLSINPQEVTGLSSLVCVEGATEDGNCATFVATVTPLFLVDLKKFNNGHRINSKVEYFIGGKSLQIFVDMPKEGEDQESIYFRYWHSGANQPIYIAHIPRNSKCGTKNPDICVIAFHFYMYFSSRSSGNDGAYLSHIDALQYTDENDQFLYYRDEKWKNEKVGFFQSIADFITARPSYGKKLFGFNTTQPIFSAQGIQARQFYKIYMDGDFIGGYTFNTQFKSSSTYGYSYTKGDYSYVLGISNYDAYLALKSDNIMIRDFLAGNDNGRLRGNLTDYFGATGIIGGVVNNNTGEVETDPNIYNDENFNQHCSATDLGCHINNLGVTIKKSFTSLFGGLFDGIKGIFVWLWETLKGFFLPYIQPIWDYFYSFYEPVYNIITGKTTINQMIWGNQEYMCSKNQSFFIEDTTATGKKPIEALGAFLYFINPIPPPDGTRICTSLGMKEIRYNQSTFVDIILFNIFVFAGIWFAFIGLRKYN